jgi:hypothetical protein
VTDDPNADELRQLLEQIQQELLDHQVAAGWNGGVSGPVMRPISGSMRMTGLVDARLANLAWQVIGLAEARAPLVPVGGVQLRTLGVNIQGEVGRVIVRALPGEVTLGEGQKPIPARKELLTNQRMFMTVIGLISICLLLFYIDLSAEDRDLLMAAVAIAGLAGWAYDHFKIDPPKE